MNSITEKKIKKRYGIPSDKVCDIEEFDGKDDELTLRRCVLKRAEFSGGRYESSHIKSCGLISVNFVSADFSKSKFDCAFIEGSRLNGAKFGYEQIKGLTIDQAQATYIALLAGVNIE